jgi:hypothetical protein
MNKFEYNKTYTAEEQKENRREWTNALRSSEYKQTTGCLKSDDCYCCLGVACSVAGLEFQYSEDSKEYFTGEEEEGSNLPIELLDFYGLESTEGSFYSEEFPSVPSYSLNLVYLNDVKLSTFTEIADIIDSNPKGLLKDA